MAGRSFKIIAAFGVLVAGLGFAPMTIAQNTLFGGGDMQSDRNIVENLVNSGNHTMFVEALEDTGLVFTLQGPGQFTVFAPTDAAFRKLPRGLVEALFTPEENAALRRILNGHIVFGRYTTEQILALAENNGGGVAFPTLSGDSLGFQAVGGLLYVVDERQRAARATIRDVAQSNGIVHFVDVVLLPQ